MKVGILTFQFPYTYGAMLQAYALKSYIEKKGNETYVLPYFPVHFQQGYSISPFQAGISLKHKVYNAVTYCKKRTQVSLFEQFKDVYLYSNREREVSEEAVISKCMKNFDIVFYGSDQIWNDLITKGDPLYFGAKSTARKISYAASMGTIKCSDIQKKLVAEFLPDFYKLSVREPESQTIIDNEIHRWPELVCDPVFLKSVEEWRQIEKPVKTPEKYMLLYMLENNRDLFEKAQNYAQKCSLEIIEIHPSLTMRHKKTKLMRNVGPREFVYLIDHAESICTNSFHCVSFSIIFKKRLLHIPNSNSPERTRSILNRVSIFISDRDYVETDLSESRDNGLIKLIETSKQFLEDALSD